MCTAESKLLQDNDVEPGSKFYWEGFLDDECPNRAAQLMLNLKFTKGNL
jgi:hypothetical protein